MTTIITLSVLLAIAVTLLILTMVSHSETTLRYEKLSKLYHETHDKLMCAETERDFFKRDNHHLYQRLDKLSSQKEDPNEGD